MGVEGRRAYQYSNLTTARAHRVNELPLQAFDLLTRHASFKAFPLRRDVRHDEPSYLGLLLLSTPVSSSEVPFATGHGGAGACS